ncbi:MAG TPA: 4Fe-4S dicluster domain-containing protein [bacterium]|nr:4Fe-4S dicluster domain-containing protein [bacterium]
MVKPRRILIKEEYCIGCRLCEVYCITQHSPSKDIIRTYKGSEVRPVSGIYFEEKGSVSFAIQCRHCDEAPCIENCLTGAMYRDEKTGRVLHNRDKCVGCWMCVMSCPLGVIKIDYEKKKVVSKCDLCIDREFPACVEHCPNEAILLVDEKGERVEKKSG